MPMNSSDHNSAFSAATWMLLGVTGGLTLDLFAKAILEMHSLTQFVLLRSIIGIVFLLAIAPRFGGIKSLRTTRYGWHLFRTLCAVGAMFGFFYGVAHMPLVDALTLGYTAPLMVTALAALFLRDAVGWRRWTAVIVGFGGVLIMLRPGSGELSFAAVAVLMAAFFYACQAITARFLGKTESTLSLSFYVILGPLLVSAAVIDTDAWITPDFKGWLFYIGAAAGSVVAWIGFINGYRAASPAALAPLEYVALVGGAFAGYLIWGEVPDRWVIAGAIVIVASSLFVVYRSEAHKKKAGTWPASP
jgi:drug/metabolite transporter (DMT)-like permease